MDMLSPPDMRSGTLPLLAEPPGGAPGWRADVADCEIGELDAWLASNGDLLLTGPAPGEDEGDVDVLFDQPGAACW
jgi:hypothetical protein